MASAQAEDDNGGSEPAYRYIETLPGGVSHAIFKLHDNGRLDNTPEVTVPKGRLFVMGDNRDNSADSRVPVRDGGVGLLPMDDLVGRADAVVGSWDLGIRGQPVWTWLSGFRRAVLTRCMIAAPESARFSRALRNPATALPRISAALPDAGSSPDVWCSRLES